MPTIDGRYYSVFILTGFRFLNTHLMEVNVKITHLTVELIITKERLSSIIVNGSPHNTYRHIPCLKGYFSCDSMVLKFDIDIDSGVILNWEKGTHASFHCIASRPHFFVWENNDIIRTYYNLPKAIGIVDNDNKILRMKVDKDGLIKNWSYNFYKPFN